MIADDKRLMQTMLFWRNGIFGTNDAVIVRPVPYNAPWVVSSKDPFNSVNSKIIITPDGMKSRGNAGDI